MEISSVPSRNPADISSSSILIQQPKPRRYNQISNKISSFRTTNSTDYHFFYNRMQGAKLTPKFLESMYELGKKKCSLCDLHEAIKSLYYPIDIAPAVYSLFAQNKNSEPGAILMNNFLFKLAQVPAVLQCATPNELGQMLESFRYMHEETSFQYCRPDQLVEFYQSLEQNIVRDAEHFQVLVQVALKHTNKEPFLQLMHSDLVGSLSDDVIDTLCKEYKDLSGKSLEEDGVMLDPYQLACKYLSYVSGFIKGGRIPSVFNFSRLGVMNAPQRLDIIKAAFSSENFYPRHLVSIISSALYGCSEGSNVLLQATDHLTQERENWQLLALLQVAYHLNDTIGLDALLQDPRICLLSYQGLQSLFCESASSINMDRVPTNESLNEKFYLYLKEHVQSKNPHAHLLNHLRLEALSPSQGVDIVRDYLKGDYEKDEISSSALQILFRSKIEPLELFRGLVNLSLEKKQPELFVKLLETPHICAIDKSQMNQWKESFKTTFNRELSESERRFCDLDFSCLSKTLEEYWHTLHSFGTNEIALKVFDQKIGEVSKVEFRQQSKSPYSFVYNIVNFLQLHMAEAKDYVKMIEKSIKYGLPCSSVVSSALKDRILDLESLYRDILELALESTDDFSLLRNLIDVLVIGSDLLYLKDITDMSGLIEDFGLKDFYLDLHVILEHMTAGNPRLQASFKSTIDTFKSSEQYILTDGEMKELAIWRFSPFHNIEKDWRVKEPSLNLLKALFFQIKTGVIGSYPGPKVDVLHKYNYLLSKKGVANMTKEDWKQVLDSALRNNSMAELHIALLGDNYDKKTLGFLKELFSEAVGQAIELPEGPLTETLLKLVEFFFGVFVERAVKGNDESMKGFLKDHVTKMKEGQLLSEEFHQQVENWGL